jgi:hypothetical protein
MSSKENGKITLPKLNLKIITWSENSGNLTKFL